MNTETDRDLTTKSSYRVDCSSGMTFQGSLRTSSCMTPPPYYPGRVNPNPLGCDTGIFADFRDRPTGPYRIRTPNRCGFGFAE